MGKRQDEIVTKEEMDEITRRLKEKVKRGNYTAEDLDEYIAASKPYMDRFLTKEHFDASMDIVQAHLDKLIALMEQAVSSTSATHQQHV